MTNRKTNSPLVLHIGVGKTATTTFQESFFPMHPQIDYLGKTRLLGDRHPQFRAAMRDFILKDSADYSPATLQQLLAQATTSSSVPLYSDENILDASRDLGMTIERIGNTFPGCKVIVTIREQRSFLTSLYGHDNNKLKGLPDQCNGQFISINNWLAYKEQELARQAGPLFLIGYDKIISALHRVLGSENVGIFLFEEFIADRTNYLKKLCAFMGVDYLPALDQTMSQAHFNKGTADRWLQKHLWMEDKKNANNWISQSNTLLRMAGALYSNFHKEPTRPKINLPEAWNDRLAALFAESNRKVMERYNLPLREYGYAVKEPKTESTGDKTQSSMKWAIPLASSASNMDSAISTFPGRA